MFRRAVTLAITVVAFGNVLFAQTTCPVDGEACRPPGPLRIRDMTPPAIWTLGFMPASASLVGKGNWGFETHYSWANIFLMSDEVEAYLRERGSPDPLTETDFRNILGGTENDVFFFDGEIGVFILGVHYGIDDRVQLFAQMQYDTFSGGFLDHTIIQFHDAFGFPQAGRDLVARNRYHILMRLGDTVVEETSPPPDGFGDPVIGVRHSLPSPGAGWILAMEWAIKPPVADADTDRSSGSFDFGMQVMGEKHWARNALYLSASYVWPGEFVRAGFFPADIPSLTVAWTHQISPRFTIVAQGLVSGSIFADETDSGLSSVEYQFSGGVRYRMGKVILSGALTENLVNFQNTPDIGIHMGVCFTL